MFEEKRFYSKNRPGAFLPYLYHSNSTDSCPRKLPLLFYIHGAGGRGEDLSVLRDMVFVKEIESGRREDCVALLPQCCCDTWFELFDVLLEFIDAMRHLPEVDMDRVYITGASMGGYTLWQIAMSRPSWFAAAVPICGGGMYWNGARLKNLPIWAFHGALDTTVLPEETLHMVKSVNQAGGSAKLTILPNAAHDAWTPAFTDDRLWKWMFSQTRQKSRFQLEQSQK